MGTSIITNKPIFLNSFLPFISSYNIDSFIDTSEKIESRVLGEKLLELKNDLGEDLYNSIDNETRKFMIDTSGIIDLGENVNMDLIYESIREHDYN